MLPKQIHAVNTEVRQPMLLGEPHRAVLLAWDVIFPDLVAGAQPEIQPLLDFVSAGYAETGRFADVPFHGEAIIYRWRTAPGG